MNTKILALALGGTLLVGCLTGCKTAASSPGGIPSPGAAAPQASDTHVQIAVANAESNFRSQWKVGRCEGIFGG